MYSYKGKTEIHSIIIQLQGGVGLLRLYRANGESLGIKIIAILLCKL